MTNKDLVDGMISGGYLVTKRIVDAFLNVDRIDFVPSRNTKDAYTDAPVSLEYDVTTSQPSTIAFMLEKLRPKEGDKILEIGAGSGYLTAILAYITGNRGRVFAFEYIPEIKKMAKENLKKYEFSAKGGSASGGKNIVLTEGDAKNGIPEEAPFDKIIASAEAREIPEAWKKQLKIGGRLITAFDGKLRLIEKRSANNFKTEDFPYFAFVELK